jgi:hypothetical protein
MPDQALVRHGCRLAAALAAAGGPLQGWHGQAALQQWAGTQLLAAGLTALGCSASAPAQADVLQLLRTLLVQHLVSVPGTRQVAPLPVAAVDTISNPLHMLHIWCLKCGEIVFPSAHLLDLFSFHAGADVSAESVRDGRHGHVCGDDSAQQREGAAWRAQSLPSVVR